MQVMESIMSDRTIPLRSVDMIDVVGDTELNRFNTINQNTNSIGQIQNFVTIERGGDVIPIFEKVNAEIVQQLAQESEIKVFATKDQKLLNEYYALRYEAYRDEWGFENFNQFESEFDKQGQIFIALKNGQLVGGACVMFSEDCELLSNEIPNTRYNYTEVLKTLDERSGLSYSEVSGVVVAKNHRDRSVTEKIFEKIISESKNRNHHYVVGISLLAIAREYRIVFKRLNHQLIIVLNYPWKQKETYNFLRMFPMCVKVL